jgi:hypothetical protein
MSNNSFFIGKHHGDNIYLDKPTWSCGWYWSFGILGSKSGLTHIDSIASEYQCTIKEALDKYFGNTLRIRPSLKWTFAELVKTAYILKDTAEFSHRGGAGYTSNPLTYLLKDEDQEKRINETLLPEVFKAMAVILNDFVRYKADIKTLQQMLIEGDTKAIIDFMFDKKIKCEDIKPHINNHDYSIIHTAYYKRVHNK